MLKGDSLSWLSNVLAGPEPIFKGGLGLKRKGFRNQQSDEVSEYGEYPVSQAFWLTANEPKNPKISLRVPNVSNSLPSLKLFALAFVLCVSLE